MSAVGFVTRLAGAVSLVIIFTASFKALEILKIAEDAKLGFAPAQFLLTFLIVTAVSMAASALPAWKATRIEPSEALVAL
jgi:putative ABC transport system permease protein